MPELPEVEALARFLGEQAGGKSVDRIELAAISALKTFDPPLSAFGGQRLDAVGRRGKVLLLEFGGPLVLGVHLARAGWVQWRDEMGPKTPKLTKGPLALRVRFEGGAGFDVTEAGTEKRLAVYTARSIDDIERVSTLGPDPLDPAFDAAALAALLAGRKAQIKKVLTDQEVVAGIGNAYSDDILHAARLSPFKMASSLTSDEVGALYSAIRDVLTGAVERSLGLPAAGLKQEKRAGMRVHGRAGQPCPVCGDTVREVSFATKALQYCATCQTGGKPLADRRLSRLLK